MSPDDLDYKDDMKVTEFDHLTIKDILTSMLKTSNDLAQILISIKYRLGELEERVKRLDSPKEEN